MINISFPDGAVRTYEKGITPLGIAKSISEGLAKKMIAASVDGVVKDLSTPLQGMTMKAVPPFGIPLHIFWLRLSNPAFQV
jgi:hypothetical protein